MESETSAPLPPRKRPHSDIKSSLGLSVPHEDSRRRSTGSAAGFTNKAPPLKGYSSTEASALAQFKFFDDDDRDSDTAPLANNNVDTVRNSVRELSGNVFDEQFGTDVSETPPPPQLPEYIITGTWRLEDLVHPSGSPVLERNYTIYAGPPSKLDGRPVFAAQEMMANESQRRTEDVAKSEQGPGGDSATRKRKPPAIRESVIAHREEPIPFVAKQVAGPNSGELSLKPKIVDISKSQANPEHSTTSRNRSTGEHSGHRGTRKKKTSGAEGGSIRRKSVPVSIEPEVDVPTSTLEATQKWLKDLADDEAENWSDESVLGSLAPPKKSLSLYAQPKAQSLSRSNLPGDSAVSSSKPMSSEKSSDTPSHKSEGKREQPNPARRPKNVRPATPGPKAQPASPPLHRNAADTRKPLEQADRENLTLYNLSCWTKKSHLKTLLRGPVLEFRTEPHGPPFLKNVYEKMLKHFCGDIHFTRLLKDYTLVPSIQREGDEDHNVLVFPEALVSATAIMRIVRYMRRCCMRTTTLTKPHFQLHAPPSLEANIETIRACNIFGLYADARRLQFFLIDKKIPGGKLSMEDVEVLWEGYDGDLRDSAYTDSLLTHIVYNILGSDSVDREELMMLLDQEEFAGLRELVGYELGVKKSKAEEKEVFMMRKQREREDKRKREKGEDKGPSELERFQAKRGPMVQGRLLRVLSYDALMETDPTAETRYKRRPGLGRRSVSTPDLSEDGEINIEDSKGWLYQNALKEIKEHGKSVNLTKMTKHRTEEVERDLWPEMKISRKPVHNRPSAPTPSGRREELGESHNLELEEHSHPPARSRNFPHSTQRPERVANPINDQAVKVREPIERKPSVPQTTNQPTYNAFDRAKRDMDRREADQKQPSRAYNTDEELARFLHSSQNQASRYKDRLTTLPHEEATRTQALQSQMKMDPSTSQLRRPQPAHYGNSYAASRMPSSVGNSTGKRQPGASVANAHQERSIVQNQPMLRSRADPWWTTLGSTAPETGEHSSSKLKRLWYEVRSLY